MKSLRPHSSALSARQIRLPSGNELERLLQTDDGAARGGANFQRSNENRRKTQCVDHHGRAVRRSLASDLPRHERHVEVERGPRGHANYFFLKSESSLARTSSVAAGAWGAAAGENQSQKLARSFSVTRSACDSLQSL